jgi:hypothetical protein
LHGRRCVIHRAARWYSYVPKITLWVSFWATYNGKCLNILWSFLIFYGYLMYLHITYMGIWYILWSFSLYSPFW